MATAKERACAKARELGFGDIRFAEADSPIRNTHGERLCLSSIMDGVSCIIVLFADYLPAPGASNGKMALSPYYVASDFAYHAARKLAVYLEENGARALHTTNISAKEAALRTGGFIGDNGFYYHPRFGSYVSIQTILTNAIEPEVYEDYNKECLHCGACSLACRGDINKCLRFHINGVVPESLRDEVYQLFGCEKCQTVCPQNSGQQTKPHEFGLEELLGGKYIREIKLLAGANLVRARRLLSQAVLYAANTNARHLAPKIKELSETADEPVKTHAIWAYEKLTGEKKC